MKKTTDLPQLLKNLNTIYTKVSQTIKTPEQAEAYERHKLICRNNYRLKHGLPLLDGLMPTDSN